jgi:hypothetical protein
MLPKKFEALAVQMRARGGSDWEDDLAAHVGKMVQRGPVVRRVTGVVVYPVRGWPVCCNSLVKWLTSLV